MPYPLPCAGHCVHYTGRLGDSGGVPDNMSAAIAAATSSALHSNSHRYRLPDRARKTELFFVMVVVTPCLVFITAACMGGIIAAFEGWTFANGFLYVLSNSLGLANPLTQSTPSAQAGIITDAIASTLALSLMAYVFAVVGSVEIIGYHSEVITWVARQIVMHARACASSFYPPSAVATSSRDSDAASATSVECVRSVGAGPIAGLTPVAVADPLDPEGEPNTRRATLNQLQLAMESFQSEMMRRLDALEQQQAQLLHLENARERQQMVQQRAVELLEQLVQHSSGGRSLAICAADTSSDARQTRSLPDTPTTSQPPRPAARAPTAPGAANSQGAFPPAPCPPTCKATASVAPPQRGPIFYSSSQEAHSSCQDSRSPIGASEPAAAHFFSL